jgi:hypothetical protein
LSIDIRAWTRHLMAELLWKVCPFDSTQKVSLSLDHITMGHQSRTSFMLHWARCLKGMLNTGCGCWFSINFHCLSQKLLDFSLGKRYSISQVSVIIN